MELCSVFTGCGLCVHLRQLLAWQGETMYHLWSQVIYLKDQALLSRALQGYFRVSYIWKQFVGIFVTEMMSV